LKEKNWTANRFYKKLKWVISNGENVIVKNWYTYKKLFENSENWIQNMNLSTFSSFIALKIKLFITFISLLKNEWFKYFWVDINWQNQQKNK